MAKFIARKTFQSLDGTGLKTAGDPVEVNNKNIAQKLRNKGLIRPVYSTKEDKKAQKVDKPEYSYKQNGSWYTIYSGDKKIDKFQGKDGLDKYGLS